MRRSTPLRLAVIPVLILGAAACENATTVDSDSSARVRVFLTDAPSDYIQSAMVTVSHVYLVGSAEEPTADERIDVFHDPDNPKVFDLMTLRDGVVAEVATAAVPAGAYKQLRLVVDDAKVTLAEGYEFADGGTEMTLKVPSGSTSGIKVQLARDVEASEGAVAELVVDFDIDQNFKLQGNPDTPAGIKGILFTPVLKELSRSQAPS